MRTTLIIAALLLSACAPGSELKSTKINVGASVARDSNLDFERDGRRYKPVTQNVLEPRVHAGITWTWAPE